MGAPMARHLARAGHDVVVYNRTASKSLAWVALNGHRAAPTPAEAAADADIVAHVRRQRRRRPRGRARAAWVRSPAMGPGSILVDHTTASAGVARELAAACLERGVGFVDAPVSGGQAGAENGQLTVMCGCDDAEVFERAASVIDAYAKSCVLLGPRRIGTADQDGQPDLHRRPRPRRWPRASTSPSSPGSTSTRSSTSSARARRRAGRWTTGPERWRRASTSSGSPSSGCARTSASCSTRRAATAPGCPSRRLVDQFYKQIVARGGDRWDTSSLMHLLDEA